MNHLNDSQAAGEAGAVDDADDRRLGRDRRRASRLRRHEDRALVRVLAGLAVFGLVVAAVLGFVMWKNIDRIDNAEQELARQQVELRAEQATNHNAELAACRRLKLVRMAVNRIGGIAYTVFIESAERERLLATRDQPTDTRQSHLRSAHALQSQANSLTWTPQTDCQAAVDNPLGYRAPGPHSYSDLLLADSRTKIMTPP